MNERLNLVFALAAGLLGGLLVRFAAPLPVFAQNQPAVTKEIRAQSFTLVDTSDHAMGTFTVETMTVGGKTVFRPPVRIVLLDRSGREIWSAGGSPFHPLTER